MAKFCEGCPDREQCLGEIQTIDVYGVIPQQPNPDEEHHAQIYVDGVPIGPTKLIVAFRDNHGGRSKALSFYGENGNIAANNAQGYIEKVGRCPEPEMTKFIGLTLRRRCAAPNS